MNLILISRKKLYQISWLDLCQALTGNTSHAIFILFADSLYLHLFGEYTMIFVSNIAFCGTVYFLLFLLLVIGLKANPCSGASSLLSRFNSLRGIFAIEIILGHVIREDKTLLFPLGKIMIISVAFFFFVSAFGLSQSFHANKHYLDGFIRRKCGYLIYLILLIFLFNTVIAYFSPVETPYFPIKDAFVLHIFSVTNWYLIELLFFYLLFYCVYKYWYAHRYPIIIAVTAAGVVIAFYAGLQEHWYASALTFPLGLIFMENYECCSRFLSSPRGYLTVFVSTCLGMCSLLFGNTSLIGMVILRNLMCISAILLLAIILIHFEVSNPLLKYLTRYSTELYLCQFVFLRITENAVSS
ncbi:MAG: hypothetical protein K6F56_07835 [Oscillospiraceae bacterium]|nr:hypothetical protein [Oscillospiraceae bacterium]